MQMAFALVPESGGENVTIMERLQRGAASGIGANLSSDKCVALIRLIDAVIEVPPVVRDALRAVTEESDDDAHHQEAVRRLLWTPTEGQDVTRSYFPAAPDARSKARKR